jgi:hypothetical protein
MKKHSGDESDVTQVRGTSPKQKTDHPPGVENSIAKSKPSEPAQDDLSSPLPTERERKIIDDFMKERQETQDFLRRLAASPAEEELLTALIENRVKALRRARWRATIRRMDSWGKILAAIQSSAWRSPERVQEDIADILCAARLISDRTIGIETRKAGESMTTPAKDARKPREKACNRCRPFDAIDLHRIYSREPVALRRFRRVSRRFLKHLEHYQKELVTCEAALFSENVLQAFRSSIATCSSLNKMIEDVIAVEPSRLGTRSLAPDSQSPVNLAASRIISLLRRHGEKAYVSLLTCGHLLAIAWPAIERELEDPNEQEALLNRLRQAHRRSVRPPQKAAR